MPLNREQLLSLKSGLKNYLCKISNTYDDLGEAKALNCLRGVFEAIPESYARNAFILLNDPYSKKYLPGTNPKSDKHLVCREHIYGVWGLCNGLDDVIKKLSPHITLIMYDKQIDTRVQEEIRKEIIEYSNKLVQECALSLRKEEQRIAAQTSSSETKSVHPIRDLLISCVEKFNAEYQLEADKKTTQSEQSEVLIKQCQENVQKSKHKEESKTNSPEKPTIGTYTAIANTSTINALSNGRE